MYRVTRKTTVGVQVGPSFKAITHKSVGVDEHTSSSSYSRESRTACITYDLLIQNNLWSNEMAIPWLMNIGLIADERLCTICKNPMSLSPCQDRKDKFCWECRRSIAGKKHRTEISICQGSWFAGSNLSIIEVLKFTY